MNQKIREQAELICREAGKLLLDGFGSESLLVSYKSRTNLVTSKDRESENYIVGRIREFFPDHTIIAEEGSRHDGRASFVWYVDPLDATNNYAHQVPFFCVTIGIYSRAEDDMVAGVVYDPLRDEMFSAVRGQGASLNGKKIKVSETGELGISLIATGFPYCKEDPVRNNLENFNRVLPSVQGIRRLGSAALDLAYVACGRFDGYWEPELYPWDMSGGSLIVQEAGGTVTRFNMDTFDPEIPEILATNGFIHNELSALISGKDHDK